METEQTPAPTDDATGLETANGGSGTTQTAPPPATTETPDRTFTQAEVDALIKDRLARQKAASEGAAEKARRDAESAALAEQGKWKELAQAHEAKLAELTPAADRAARLEAALQAQLTSAMEGLPEHILPLIEKLDLPERLEYLAANRAKLLARPAPDTNATGRGAAQPDPQARLAELQQRYPALKRR